MAKKTTPSKNTPKQKAKSIPKLSRAKSLETPKKSSVKELPKHASTEPKSRVVTLPKYKSFRISRKIKTYDAPVPSIYANTKQSLVVIKKNWRLFLGILVAYLIVTYILTKSGSSDLSVTDYKKSLLQDSGNKVGVVSVTLSLLNHVASSTGATVTEVGKTYQSFLAIIVSLVTIWSLRELAAGSQVRVKQAFYSATGKLIPFVLVLLAIGLQLLPLVLGAWLYGLIVPSGIAVNAAQKGAVGFFAFLLSLLSLYMVASSIFALYIVTLPSADMTPMKALRSARQLVLHRRWKVLSRVLILPFILISVGVIMMLPFLLFWTAAAEPAYLAVTLMAPIAIHVYMYTLYRSLL